MKKKVWGIAAIAVVGVTAGVHFLTLPPPPPEVPPVPSAIPLPVVPALTAYDLPINGLDDIGLTLQVADDIRAFEAKALQSRPWVFNALR